MKTFKNKIELIEFVKHQLNITLVNDENETFNKNRNRLYTQINIQVERLLNQYKIRYEQHRQGYFWIFIK